MKKLLVIAMLLSMTGVSLFAEKLILIQGTYLNTSRTYEYSGDKSKRTYGEAGINITSFSGKNIGFYTSATFLLPISYKQEYNGVTQNVDIDDLNNAYNQLTLGLDMLLGIGFQGRITPSFSLLAAGGLHFNGIALMSSDYTTDPFLAYNLGPGVAVNALLYLTKTFNINISAMGAWDMLEIVTMPDSYDNFDKKGGFTWALSAGLGFAY